LKEGAHLNKAGLEEIVNIKSSLNKGNSEFVISQFSKIEPVTREKIITTKITDPH
jgi:hypothetical protein